MADDGDIVVELGNKICPIMKKAVNGRNFAEWNGLRVGTCCGGCVKKILADPETDEVLGVDWQTGVAPVGDLFGLAAPSRATLAAAAAVGLAALPLLLAQLAAAAAWRRRAAGRH